MVPLGETSLSLPLFGKIMGRTRVGPAHLSRVPCHPSFKKVDRLGDQVFDGGYVVLVHRRRAAGDPILLGGLVAGPDLG